MNTFRPPTLCSLRSLRLKISAFCFCGLLPCVPSIPRLFVHRVSACRFLQHRPTELPPSALSPLCRSQSWLFVLNRGKNIFPATPPGKPKMFSLTPPPPSNQMISSSPWVLRPGRRTSDSHYLATTPAIHTASRLSSSQPFQNQVPTNWHGSCLLV
jgi:hypothetical protein